MIRFLGSLAAGVIVAAVMVGYEDHYRRAALAASAARPLPGGGHQSIASILTLGGVCTAVVIAAVVYAIAALRARARRSRSRAVIGQDWDTRYPRARHRGAGSWR